jgi:hypothetical protein
MELVAQGEGVERSNRLALAHYRLTQLVPLPQVPGEGPETTPFP